MGAIAVWVNKYLKKIKQCVQLVSQLVWWYVQLVLRMLLSITDARYFRSGWIINGWSESTLDNWQYQSHIGQSLHAIWVRKLPEASNKSHQYWSNWNVPVCTLHTLCLLVWVCPVKLIGTIWKYPLKAIPMLFKLEANVVVVFFLWKLETLIYFQLIQNWNDCGQNGTISQHWVYAWFYVINSKCRQNAINWKQNCAKTKQEIKALNGFVGRFWHFA